MCAETEKKGEGLQHVSTPATSKERKRQLGNRPPMTGCSVFHPTVTRISHSLLLCSQNKDTGRRGGWLRLEVGRDNWACTQCSHVAFYNLDNPCAELTFPSPNAPILIIIGTGLLIAKS